MKLKQVRYFDVLVAGSGIAGLSAAREAAVCGCKTAIMSQTRLFSGSSFYPGTWGFGLVGPENEEDHEDMISTIRRVGCGMADPHMVREFVSGINPAISHLESMGCRPKKANKSTEREYIPCFDHKHRNWNGLEADGLRETFSRQIKEQNITVLDHCTLLELVKENDRVCGAVVSCENRLEYIGCKALILATGGYGSLFSNHLCTDDVSGLGQYLALKAGCRLINMEFLQMMPGCLYPARNTVFNEKTFRFARFSSPDHRPLFDEKEEALLDLRSFYGPFTSRLASRVIDEKLYQATLESPDGALVSYAEAAKNNPPEFVKIYFDWLKSEKHVDVSDPIHIGIFSHAANGGIRIDPQGWTGVNGLYACGEATGGMHGADRIGGLSTANGLVFGQRAGKAGASWALKAPAPAKQTAFSCRIIKNRSRLKIQLQNLMYQNAMIIRTEEGLSATLDQLHRLLASHQAPPEEFEADFGLTKASEPLTAPEALEALTASRILEGQFMTAACMLKAALLRKESRGSHFRSDFPAEDPRMAAPIEILLKDRILAEFIR